MVGFFHFNFVFYVFFFLFPLLLFFFFHLLLLVGDYLCVFYSECCGKTFYYSQIQIMVQKLHLF